jgi:hypothetical protein
MPALACVQLFRPIIIIILPSISPIGDQLPMKIGKFYQPETINDLLFGSYLNWCIVKIYMVCTIISRKRTLVISNLNFVCKL